MSSKSCGSMRRESPSEDNKVSLETVPVRAKSGRRSL